MKQLFLGTLLIISLSVQSQTTDIFPTESGRVFYNHSQKVDSTLTKDHLFTLSKMWLAFIFVDSREVIVMEDREGGVIMGKGSFVNNLKTGFGLYKITVSFRMTVKMKNGGYTMQVSDFEAKYVAMNTLQQFTPDNRTPTKNAKNIYSWRRDTNDIIEDMIGSLYKYIQKNKGDFIRVSPDEKKDY